MKYFFKVSLFYFVLFFVQGFFYGQTLNLQSIPNDELRFGFKFQKPFYNSGLNISALSGTYEISTNIPLSSGLNINGIIPYINNSYEVNLGFTKFKYENSGVGNIFIGLQTKPVSPNNGNSFITFGLFLPTASEDAADFLTDYYNLQKFLPHTLGIYFNYAFHKNNPRGFIYGLEIGPNVIIPTEDRSADTEIFLHYGAVGGYQLNKFVLNVELSGIGILTQQVDVFFDRFIQQIGFGAQWKEQMVTPKIFYRIFLRDELRNMVDGVLGLGATVQLN